MKVSPFNVIMAFCESKGFPCPQPEYRFALPRKFAFDFAWPERRLALEIEGAIFGMGKPCPFCKRRQQGGHTSVEGLKRDILKYNLAAERGWRLLRFTPEMIAKGKAFPVLERILRKDG